MLDDQIMMKRIMIKLFLIGSCLIAFTSCYKDQGNYDYALLTDFHVDTASINRVLVISQFSSPSIDPHLIFAGDKNKLAYVWRVYGRNTGVSLESIPDTLCRTEHFSGTFTPPPGNYWLEFSACEPETGRTIFSQYRLTIESANGMGLIVLYERNGSMDCDLIKTRAMVGSYSEDAVLRNILSQANPNRIPPGKPVGIGMYSYSTAKYLTLLTDEDAVRLSPLDMAITNPFDELFYDAPSVARPHSYYVLVSGLMEVMINNGRFYVSTPYATPDDPRLAGAIIGDYYATPYVCRSAIGFFCYDQKNLRFLYTGNAGPEMEVLAAPVGLFDFNNIGKEMIYMAPGFGDRINPSGSGVIAYAFFKDLVDNGKRYVYVMDITQNNQNLAATKALLDISACPEITEANLFTLGTRGPILFYAANNNIYQIQYELSLNSVIDTRVVWPNIPSGEKITCLELSDHAGINLAESALNKYLFVATYNESTGEGKVYILVVNVTTGTCEPEPYAVYSQFGRVKDIMFKFE